RPERLITILNEYAASLEQSLAELTAVREGLGGGEQFRFPALCAGWGQAYYQAELTIARQLARQLAAQQSPQPAALRQPASRRCARAWANQVADGASQLRLWPAAPGPGWRVVSRHTAGIGGCRRSIAPIARNSSRGRAHTASTAGG